MTLVVSRSPFDHRRHLHVSFDRINEYEFRVRLTKCSFHSSIKYLGFIVHNDGRRPNPKTITAVADMPAPTITPLCSFLMLVSYYQSFVRKIRSIRQPLDDLPKDTEWKWLTRCQQLLRALKAFFIWTSSSLTMARRLKWSSQRTRQNTGWVPSYNTGGQMAQ